MGSIGTRVRRIPCERLARMEGASNFLSLLAGVEQARTRRRMPPPCLSPVASLQCRRGAGGSLGASQLYRPAICQLGVRRDGRSRRREERDRLWVKASILDAFRLFTTGHAPIGTDRARQFKTRTDAYYATPKFALSMLQSMANEAERYWIAAVRITGNWLHPFSIKLRVEIGGKVSAGCEYGTPAASTYTTAGAPYVLLVGKGHSKAVDSQDDW